MASSTITTTTPTLPVIQFTAQQTQSMGAYRLAHLQNVVMGHTVSVNQVAGHAAIMEG
jgi:hypothetical protein